MGYGDNLMATGMAKGAGARGKMIAFGDGNKILWDQNSAAIFKGNPNIAPPGSESSSNIEWINFYKGNRIYNKHDHKQDRWLWNYSFRAQPGEVFFTDEELTFAEKFGKDFVIVEPHVPDYKGCAPNKRWQFERYIHLVGLLKRRGLNVQQFRNNGTSLPGVGAIKTPSFRHALAVLSQAALYVGSEGGLHHGAAAVGIPAVVIFGGFIPPQVTGYKSHTNLTGGATKFCGSLRACTHCRTALEAIKIKHVHHAVKEILECSTSYPGFGEPSGHQFIPNDCLQESGVT